MAKSKKTVRPSRKSVKKRPVPSLWSKQRRTHYIVPSRANGPLHRRVVLHPTTLFGLLLVGVLLAGLTYRSSALQYVVSAVVHAPMLTTGATISSPSSEPFTSEAVTVSGICPTAIRMSNCSRNGMFSGSAVCVNNVFQIQSGPVRRAERPTGSGLQRDG